MEMVLRDDQGSGSTPVRFLYRDNAAGSERDAFIDNTNFGTLQSGTYSVAVLSFSGGNGPSASAIRTDNIDRRIFADLPSNAADTFEYDDVPSTFPVGNDKTVPTNPVLLKPGSMVDRCSGRSAGLDWDWFTFTLP